MERISNQASKNKVTYMNGKAPKEDTYYNTTQLSCLIYEMTQIKGQNETIQYLEDKIQTIKKMQGAEKKTNSIDVDRNFNN